tara:strand:- start:107 stop:586 length:480 start_codon:yes stop_codon:yes gene_type:complete
MDLEFIFFIAFLFGCVGAFLGGFVDKDFAGFWLGCFLGPIGWVIVFLLPRENNSLAPKASPPQPYSLDNDEYKIWLVEAYHIQKNETLNQYVCENKLFDSVDLAVEFAHSAEIQLRQEDMKRRMTSINLPHVKFLRHVKLSVIILGFILSILLLAWGLK